MRLDISYGFLSYKIANTLYIYKFTSLYDPKSIFSGPNLDSFNIETLKHILVQIVEKNTDMAPGGLFTVTEVFNQNGPSP